MKAETVYVDHLKGDDSAAGTKEAPVKGLAQAVSRVDGVGGEIHLNPDNGPFREPLVIKKGGTAENPLVVDGHGAVINLGIDITRGPWVDTGDGYLLEQNFPWKAETGTYQITPVFVNGLGLMGDHPKGPEYAARAWHKGYVRLDEQGRWIVVFPEGLSPKNSVIVLTNSAIRFSCAVRLDNASNVIVKNITAAFSANDGFNFHGHGRNVTLLNVKALFNSDEGMSSHETYEVNVRDSELAFNGSQGGGVQDVQDCVTNYYNVRSHQNRASGFNLGGKAHILEGAVAYGNGAKNLPKEQPNLTMKDGQDTGPFVKEIPVVEDVDVSIDISKPVDEGDRLGRFLQLRPPAGLPIP